MFYQKNFRIYLEFTVFLLLVFAAFVFLFALPRQLIFVFTLEIIICCLMIAWWIKNKFIQNVLNIPFFIVLIMILVSIKNPCNLLFAEVAHVKTIKQAILNKSARYFIIENLFLDKNLHQYSSHLYRGIGKNRAITTGNFKAEYPIFDRFSDKEPIAWIGVTKTRPLNQYYSKIQFDEYDREYKKWFKTNDIKDIIMLERINASHYPPYFVAHFQSYEDVIKFQLQEILIPFLIVLTLGLIMIGVGQATELGVWSPDDRKRTTKN